MDDDERQRKLETGRAKKASDMPRSQSLACYRQKRAKGNSAGTSKKTQKRKGQTVSQNDGATQGRPVDAALSSANDTELNKKTNHEEPQKPEKSKVQKDQPPALEQSPSPVEDIEEEELVALTGKEQLKQLQEAVERRNEIIARLSSNLQEALASRDQVQLEAQSLAGQIQGLQRQLQQTSVEFLRIKSQSGAEVLNTRQPHGRCSQDADLNHKEAPSGSAAPETISCVEGFSTETDTALEKLRVELEEERKNSQRIYAELALEMEKHQHVLSLLEKEKKSREEEQKEKEEQLQDLQMQFSLVQTQCLEMQQYKEEKEKLNREVLELRKRLQEEADAERRLGEEVASSALRLQRQEEEMLRLKEEHREEVEGVRQLLEEREKELKFREEEVLGLKASKNRQNKAKAGFSFDEKVHLDEADLETGPVENSMNVSVDILMERYMSSHRPAHSQSSMAGDSLERCGQLDISADYSFELNSEVLGDEPLLSISNRFLEEDDNRHNTSTPHCSPGIPLPDNSNPQSPSQWFYDSTPDELETSKLSEQQFEQTDLEKELLNQQCGELRDELLLKDRDLNVLREEVINTAEELEEARSRWGQVTEELRQALWDLEEEKEKKRLAEEEMNLKAHEQDNLKNKLSALMEEREKEKAVLLTGKEAAETSLLLPAITPSEEEDELVGELKNKQAALPSHQKQQDLLLLSQQETKQPAISAEQILELRDDKPLQTLQVEATVGQLETLQSELGLKEVELKHLALQLEQLTNQNAAHVNELQEQIDVLKENVSALTILNEEREEQSEAEEPEEENFPSALLEEKNQEIDHLNADIQRLEQELDNTGDNKALEAELEDLRSQVEHLQSEVMRVRQDTQEEVERLHEVISTLQAELATLGPNLHEVSDSQDGDSINPSPAPSPEPDDYIAQEQARRGGAANSLKQELSLSHSASSHSLRSRFKTLQSQLEAAVAEKEGLERLLLTQEEEYRGHGEEFGKRLTAEREKADTLQSVLTLKEAELDEVKAQKEGDAEQRKLSEEVHDKVQKQEMSTLHDKNLRLNSLIAELQKKEQERVTEMDTLKTKEQEMEMETEVLRETSLTLERQVQEMRAELVDMEELVDEERIKIKTLKTVKGELSAERETLRKREGKLQEEIEHLRQEATSMRACIQELTVQLNERESIQEEAQKEVLTHAEGTLAKADAALRQREAELAGLRAEHQALKAELTAVKQGLSTSTERAEKLHEEGQTKDRALLNLETDNQRLKAQLRALQEDLAVQEEELAYQQRELQQLRQHCDQQDTLPHQRGHTQKDISHRAFEDLVSVSRDDVSLSSPEVLRRLECSEDRIPERFRASAIGSRLSEFSALNSTGLDLHHVKTSPRVVMESPRSRTITPEPATQSSRSPISGSVSVNDNFSMLDSLDTDKVRELEDLDMTTPSSLLGSTSSLSAPEWASDGYGSNVSSELGARLKVELEQTERLDAQFLEYLHCRGMNPTVNTDSAAGSMSYSDALLSPELQCLLKKVYQESCRILTLSKRRATSSTYPHVSDLRAFALSHTEHHSEGGSIVLDRRDNPPSIPPMGWQQEKRALQETVVALRELLCRMAQRPTQTEHRVEGDWHGDRVDGQVESHLRAELEESQKQLKCAHDTQQEQKNKIQVAVAEGEEALRREQVRVQELQQQLEQEQALSQRKDREKEERREALHVSSEQQRSEVMALKGLVEQERVACSNLRRELQIEQSRSELLEKRLDDTQKELGDERQLSANQKELKLQDKTRLERLLTEAESRLAEIHSTLAEAHRKVDEERERYSRQVDELSRRHEADATRDRKFISDMRAQLEQERRQGEELAAVMNKLRAELLQSRRKWEEEDRARRAELQREKEAAIRQRVAVETLKEQKQESCCALEMERERSTQQGVEVTELKEKLHLIKDKEREREEQWERERRKGRKEQMERERRQERTNDKLCELEMLRQQDQQRMQELQHTLVELEREEKEMSAQRLRQHNMAASSQHLQSDFQTGSAQHNQQMPSSQNLLERMMKENSELTERVTSLSQEKATLKHRLTFLERELRLTENELAKVTTETENRPINDVISNAKVQRLYERYLRAESFRKALVYQKRYLILLLGGFQECEQATLCLIARMGAWPTPPLSSYNRPRSRFRAVVRVVIAVSRMKFLTKKWQKAIKRLSVSGSVNGHAPGPKAEVLRQQPRIHFESPPNRGSSSVHRDTVSALVPPQKSPFRLHNRSYSSPTPALETSGGTSQDPERSLTEYIHHLEKVQQRLVGARQSEGH
ncbi:A-kinase anchor protein 9-like isoform X2 [Notothenia coriiceps]|uniref:A-kinase anchor protein 9-like isoform X2 n=1 Tax=Notothenia coriiceps TaxID=8208 RepID=A0A6I9PAK4_9TELE|nr:PREDICTED: A-kinase anchor protein 9-like isoform X2 [Notothenia coriiceps]